MTGAPSDLTVYGALRLIEDQDPVHTAVVYKDRRWTYRQLRSEVDRIAGALLARGVVRGDRVAMLCSTRIEYWTTFLATSAIGAIWVGLGLRNKLDELSFVVGDAEPRLLISLSEFEGRDYRDDLRAIRDITASIADVVTIDGGFDGSLSWEDFLEHGGSAAAVNDAALLVDPDDPAIIVYTSGTTGRPKGALLSHYGLVAGSRAQMERSAAARPVQINSFPINHIACVGDISLTNMVAGGTTILAERFDPREQLEIIERERVTVWGGIPAMVQMTLAVPDFDRFDLSSLKAVGWGGGAMPRDVIERLSTLAPRVGGLYGLTETTSNVTWTDAGAPLDVLVSTIGKPGSAFPCRVVTEDRHLCGVGEVGEIQFKAETNMLGYWKQPDATREAFTEDGWLRTGDLGIWREDGNLTLVGRRIEMYKSGGFNIYPREVEIALESHAAVEAAAVVPKADRLYNEVGHAFVMLRGDTRPTAHELDVFLRTKLANYKIPKTIQIVDALPILANGKIDKVALRKDAAAGEGPA
ncbi:MAG: AMP-binding protein [Rhizomicrobium sp.]